MVIILMMSAKMFTPGLPKTTTFWNKGYDVIISAVVMPSPIKFHPVIQIVDVVMWPKSGNSSISMREVAVSFIRIWPEKLFFEGCSWFKFDNLGLALGPNLNFYTSVVKGLKLKVRKIWELNPTFVKDTGEELVGAFLPSPLLHAILKKVKLLFIVLIKVLP